MEVMEVIIRIIGTTIILSALGVIGWTIKTVLGIEIDDDEDDTQEWYLT
jgi:hypothetical protein